MQSRQVHGSRGDFNVKDHFVALFGNDGTLGSLISWPNRKTLHFRITELLNRAIYSLLF